MVTTHFTLKSFCLIGLLACVGCGDDNPMAPSRTPDAKATVTIVPNDAPPTGQETPATPPGAPGPIRIGPLGHRVWATLPEVIEWRIEHADPAAKLEWAYDWTDDVQADSVNTGGRHTRTQNEHLRVRREGTTIFVEFDRDTFDCGSAQVDVSSNGVVWIHLVIWYGPCAPPKLNGDCLTALDPLYYRIFVHGDTATVNFRVKPGYGGFPIWLSSWRFGVDTVYTPGMAGLPQYQIAKVDRYLDGPGDYVMSVPVDATGQFDLACTIPPDVLNAASVPAFERDLLAYGYNEGQGWRYRVFATGEAKRMRQAQ